MQIKYITLSLLLAVALPETFIGESVETPLKRHPLGPLW